MKHIFVTISHYLGLCLANTITLASHETEMCGFSYLTQNIDHFGNHNGTFQQRYSIVTDFYKEGGPILMFQGEESTVLECVNETIMYTYAKELNGIAVSLEHRYFGEIKPLNATDPITQRDAFQYLTLDNVMADAATFIESIRSNISGAANAFAIVASGSYGAFLATMFRQNRPDAFWGAIASAPPLEGQSTANPQPNAYNWNTYLNKVYMERSRTASLKIQKAYAVLGEHIANGNISMLQSQFGLCSPATNITAAILPSWLQTAYSFAAEFNYNIIRPGRSVLANPLDAVINITLAQDEPLQVLNGTMWSWFGPLGTTCLNLSDPYQLANSVPLIEHAPFQYLNCKYLIMTDNQNTANGTIFPPASADIQNAAFLKYCNESFGITPPEASTMRNQYKFTPEDLMNSTRILWVLGQYDPTSSLAPTQPGINSPVLSLDINVSRLLPVSNMAHREDLFAPLDTDRDTVIQARAIELEILKGWLGLE